MKTVISRKGQIVLAALFDVSTDPVLDSLIPGKLVPVTSSCRVDARRSPEISVAFRSTQRRSFAEQKTTGFQLLHRSLENLILSSS